MNILSVIRLAGGVGMFLYGMSLLGVSLERYAGAKLEGLLERLTSNRVKGVLLGTGVTAVIQSSAATSVMVVGFVNAGIMKIVQAIPVIMGANIGTTMTAQILRLGDISSSNIYLQLLKPASFAPLCIAVGAAIVLITKKPRTKDLASILIGFGILFVGMNTMEGAMAPLKEMESFRQLFFLFKNPILGVLMGLTVTAIIQSSSAAVGLLQATSTTGAVAFSAALPILLGMNIGKVVTVVLASIGSNKKAKRVVLVDVLFNLIGVVMFLVLVYGANAIFGLPFWNADMSRGSIADFHSLFNITTTVVVLPFIDPLIRLSGKWLKDDEESKIDEELRLLDEAFLATPTVALEQCNKVVISMGEAAVENFDIAARLIQFYDEKTVAQLEDNELFLDKSESMLGEYLIKITSHQLAEEGSAHVSEIMNTLSNFERIGDRIVNVLEVVRYNLNNGIAFSEEARNELQHMTDAVSACIRLTVDAYRAGDLIMAQNVHPLEDVVDDLEELLKAKHMERLQAGLCSVQAGISFVEVLSNLERISDHCTNVVVHLTKRLRHDREDIHAHHNRMRTQGPTPEYLHMSEQFRKRFVEPINKGKPTGF